MPSTGTWEKACQGGQAPTSSVSSRLTKTHCLAVSVSDCRGKLGFRVCTQAELSAQEEGEGKPGRVSSGPVLTQVLNTGQIYQGKTRPAGPDHSIPEPASVSSGHLV